VLGFLSLPWLLGLAAVAIPVAIHLLSRKEALRVRVGSIVHLEAAAPKHVRRLALTDIPLLLLRAAITVLLALLLTRPVWRSDVTEPRHLVLAAPDAVSPRTRQIVDSLIAAGYERIPLSTDDYWDALRTADAQLAEGSRIAVVAPARLAMLWGERPALRTPVDWFDVETVTAREWRVAAHRRGPDSVRIVTAHSEAGQTSFVQRVVARDTAAVPQERHVVVWIVHDAERLEDARYVEAAARAAAEHAGLDATITIHASSSSLTGPDPDVIFWLTPTPVPPAVQNLVDRGSTLFRDATSKRFSATAQRVYGVGIDEAARPVLFRRAGDDAAGAVVWRDGQGIPLLRAERVGQGLRLRFASRLHPAWTDVVQRPVFPELLVGLLTLPGRWTVGDASYRIAPEDARRAGVDQVLPARDSVTAHPVERTQSLGFPVWVLAIALLAYERSLSARHARRS
jgi:membrane protein implicated in regulation of membrane protease activity